MMSISYESSEKKEKLRNSLNETLKPDGLKVIDIEVGNGKESFVNTTHNETNAQRIECKFTIIAKVGLDS